MAEREIKAGEFKARCLQLMDDVAATGDTIIVTKRGKPVAKLVPAEAKPLQYPKFGFFKGKLEAVDPNDDLLSAWDDEMEAAFEDGLQRTADLINTPAPKRRRSVRK